MFSKNLLKKKRMSLLDNKINELIDEMYYVVKPADRKSLEFIMNEIVDFSLAIVVPPEDTEALYNIQRLKE